MNRNIKKLIAFSLATGTITAYGQLTNSNLFTTKAYASSDDADELSDILVEDNDGDTIDLYEDSDYDDEYDEPEVGETYYAESDTKKISIDIDGAEEDYVRIFKGSTEYEVGDSISLDTSGATTLKIRVYEDEYDEDEDYSSSDYAEYKLKVEYNSDSDEDEDNQVSISSLSINSGSISSLSINGESINFSKATTSVSNNISSISVQAIPTNSSATVAINGTTVTSSNDYKKTVNLNVGNNTITVKVQDKNGESKNYTLTVNRLAQATDTNADITTQATTNTTTSGSTKYGWNLESNTWYYVYSNGTKAIGWQYIGGDWYYFDSLGKMKTGWFKDTNGKWYYLQSSGAMAKSTTIDGYKLDDNGVWIQ